MPFFKNIWKNVRNPDEVNPLAMQFAQSLLSGGDAQGPLARAGNKIVGGLLAGGQLKAQKKSEEKEKKEMEEFMGLMMPGKEMVSVTTETAPGALPGQEFRPPTMSSMTSEMQRVQGGVLAGEFDPFSPVSTQAGVPTPLVKTTSEKEAMRPPDPWGAMTLALKSKNPMLQKLGMEYMGEQMKAMKPMSPEDRYMVLPQGVVVDRQILLDSGNDFAKATVFNPIKDEKYTEIITDEKTGTIRGITPDGRAEVIDSWDPVEDPKRQVIEVSEMDETGVPYERQWLIDLRTGDKIKDLGRKLAPGAATGAYKPPSGTQNEVIAMKNQSELALGRLNTMLESYLTNEEYQNYFTWGGKIGYGWDNIRSYAGKLKPGQEGYDELVKLTTFISDVERNSARMIKDMTGAQMSEAEARRLLKGIANSTDSPAAFEGKLRSAINEIQRVYDNYLIQYNQFSGNDRMLAKLDQGLKDDLKLLADDAEAGNLGSVSRPTGVRFG
jgi:hypothetical protein